ncbi:MAG: hypothetical protein ABI670_23100 [Chloroflexota bacterium]
MAETERITAPHRALLPHEVEAEQRRFHDRRVQTWPVRIAAIVVGIIWISQLGWKLPWNDFVQPAEQPNGITANTQLTAKQPGPFVDNGAGLYHWMTLEAINGNWFIPFYGDMIKNVVLPNWKFFGWIHFILEVATAALLIIGVFSRLGGLLCSLLALNLYLGLSRAPGQWDWPFLLLFLFGFVFLFTGPGRFLGADQFLRPYLRSQILNGNRTARVFYTLT